VQDLLQGKDAEITIDDVLAEVPLGPLFHDNGQVLNRPGAFVAAPIEGSSPSTRPYLRCPSSIGVVPRDEGPIMRKLRLAASEAAGVAFNHAKVQLYETRANKIDFHADKVLDMCEDDAFVSFRLGAKRVFSLRSKAYPKVMHNIPATSNSAIVVGPRTNREWTHGVLPDKRREEQCAKEELACGESRSFFVALLRSGAAMACCSGLVLSSRQRRIWRLRCKLRVSKAQLLSSWGLRSSSCTRRSLRPGAETTSRGLQRARSCMARSLKARSCGCAHQRWKRHLHHHLHPHHPLWLMLHILQSALGQESVSTCSCGYFWVGLCALQGLL